MLATTLPCRDSHRIMERGGIRSDFVPGAWLTCFIQLEKRRNGQGEIRCVGWPDGFARRNTEANDLCSSSLSTSIY